MAALNILLGLWGFLVLYSKALWRMDHAFNGLSRRAWDAYLIYPLLSAIVRNVRPPSLIMKTQRGNIVLYIHVRYFKLSK